MISYRAVVAIFAIGGLLFFLLDQKFVSDVPPNYDTILETGMSWHVYADPAIASVFHRRVQSLLTT